jgi:HEAT repeat protein
VRFIAAMTIGDFKLAGAAHLLLPLLHDESSSVRAAAIYALRRCGQNADLSPLAEMVTGSDPEVKANAALVLGKLRNPSAVPLLRSAVGRGMSRVSPARARLVDLQIAEAMVLLGDDRQLDVVRAALFAPAAEQGEIVALACLIAGRIGDERAIPTLLDYATRTGDRRLPAEVRMAATMALASLNPEQTPIEVPLEFVNHQRPAIRAQAALTLGAIPSQQSTAALRRLMGDSDPLVQVSAAAGVLKALGG